MEFSFKNTGVSCHVLLQGLSNPGIKPRHLCLSAQSLLSLLQLLLFVSYLPKTHTERPSWPPQFSQAALQEDAHNSFC